MASVSGKFRHKTLNQVRRLLQKPSEKRTPEDLRKLHEGLLKDVKFFQNVETDVRLAICKMLKYKAYGANEIVFEEGDEGFNFYIIIEGSVAVWLRDISAEEVAEEAKRKDEEQAQRAKVEQQQKKDEAGSRMQGTKQGNVSGSVPFNHPNESKKLKKSLESSPTSAEMQDRTSKTASTHMGLDIFLEEPEGDDGEDEHEEEEDEEESDSDFDSDDDNEDGVGSFAPQINITESQAIGVLQPPTHTEPRASMFQQSEKKEAPRASMLASGGGVGSEGMEPQRRLSGVRRLSSSQPKESESSPQPRASFSRRPSSQPRASILSPMGYCAKGTSSAALSRRFSARNKQVATMSNGQSFGEVALQTSEPRTATVRTIVPTQFAILDRESYMECLKGHMEREQQERLDFMDQIRMFDDWNEDTKTKMSYLMQVRKFVKSQAVFVEDSPVTEVYFVKDGEFAIQKKVKSVKSFLQRKEADKWMTIGLHAAPQPFGFAEYLQGERRHKDRVICNSLEGTIYTLLSTKLVSHLSVEARKKLLLYSKAADKYHSKREVVLNGLREKAHSTGIKALVPESNMPRVLRREKALWVQRMPRAIIAEIAPPVKEGESPDPRERDIYSPEGRIHNINSSLCPPKKDGDFDPILNENSMWIKAFSAQTKRSIQKNIWLKNNPDVMDDCEVGIRRCWASEEPDCAWVAPQDEARADSKIADDALLKDEAYQRMLGQKLLHIDGPKPWSLNQRAPVVHRKRNAKNTRIGTYVSESQECRRGRVVSSGHDSVAEGSSAPDDCLQLPGSLPTDRNIPKASPKEVQDVQIHIDEEMSSAKGTLNSGPPPSASLPKSRMEALTQSRSTIPNESTKIANDSIQRAQTAPQITQDSRADSQPTRSLLCRQGFRPGESQNPQEQRQKWRPVHADEEEQSGKHEAVASRSANTKAIDQKWQYLMQSQAVKEAYLCLLPAEQAVDQNDDTAWYF